MEDIKNEAYVKALETFDPQREGGVPFEVWVKIQERGVKTSLLRGEKRVIRPDQMPDVPVRANQFVLAFKRERKKILFSLLKRLRRRERAILFLRFWDGISEEEIAKKLNVDKSTVSRTLASILEAFKALLEWEGFKFDDLVL